MPQASKQGGFLKPEKIVNQMGVIKPGMTISDFGSGSGYFTIPMAKLVGKDGKVYAFDVLEDALEALESKAELAGLFNIETRRVNLEKPKATGLNDNSQDCVVLSNILFQSQKKEDILKEAARILKPDKYLIVVAWEPDTAVGPSEGWRISKKEAKNLLKEKGLNHYKDFEGGRYHFGLVYQK
jgi:ubiquinone/menaquinone biosynthesis C-methylase UbiE